MSDALSNGLSFLVLLVVLAGAVMLLHEAQKAARGDGPGLADRMRRALGLPEINGLLVLIGGLLWAGLAAMLVAGLFGLIWDVTFHTLPGQDGKGLWEFRFRLAQLAVLTTVLGAVIALPITLNRLRITREQTETAKAALFNTKIADAAADLYAQRQVTRKDKKNDGKLFNGWEDDVTRRNAAIDRLEGLVKERPDEAERVSRLLSVYVRELSREHPAEPMPETDDLREIIDWVLPLTPVRSDMENAVQVLGRLAFIKGVAETDINIDLRGANLQGFDLSGKEGARLRFPNSARFSEAHMQSARLRWADMQGADFGSAQMQNANLRDARIQGAYLGGAQMQWAILEKTKMQGAELILAVMNFAIVTECQMKGANLWGAQMQGARLQRMQMEDAINLRSCNLRAASLRDGDYSNIPQFAEHVTGMFGDGSVTLPGGVRPGHPDWPAHWPTDVLDQNDFHTAWRAWQQEIGFDPQDPATW